MTRKALRDAAENLMRQRVAEMPDLVRADTDAVAFADEHRRVARADAGHVGHVQADLIHAHDPDDRAPPATNGEMPPVREGARQTLPVAECRGRDPARGFGPPRPSVADGLTGGDRTHL